jgi:hypothetical protein
LLAVPHYFLLANLASLIASFKLITGERYVKWEPVREANVEPTPTFINPEGERRRA